MKKVIWLTGGSGSGKSTVAKIISDLGITVIDADAISREILKKDTPCYLETIKAFGEDILFENGEINRKKLGGIVFTDKEKLVLLNEITHKYINMEILNKIRDTKSNTVVIDAPLPPTDKIKCDFVISVIAPMDLRVERIKERDSITEEYAKNRIASQISEEEYINQSNLVIENNSDLDTLKNKVIEIIKSFD